MRLTHTVEIAAPADRVWALTEDLERWPSITPTMKRIERHDHGPLAVGSTATVTQPRLRPAEWEVTDLDPPYRLVWETSTTGVRIVAGHQVTPTELGCRNTLSVEVTGRGAPLHGPVLGPPLRTALATENDGFRRAAEGLERPRFIDDRRVAVDGSVEQAWRAAREYAEGLVAPSGGWFPRLLGAEPSSGFRIAEEVAPRRVSLQGRHRFARYALDFRMASTDGTVEVSAISYSDFPGVTGLAYRTAVVGSHGHGVAVRRMLSTIRSQV